MQQDLTTTGGSGTQTTTQDPQSATTGTLAPVSNDLQSNSIDLNTDSGIKLTPTSATVSSLGSSSKTVSTSTLPTVKHHHVNGLLLGVFIAIFVVAIAVFWQTTIRAKNTTE